MSLKPRSTPQAYDCFKDKHNEEIEHYGQALIKTSLLIIWHGSFFMFDFSQYFSLDEIHQRKNKSDQYPLVFEEQIHTHCVFFIYLGFVIR
jgi:hypothetical protein